MRKEWCVTQSGPNLFRVQMRWRVSLGRDSEGAFSARPSDSGWMTVWALTQNFALYLYLYLYLYL